MAALPVGENHDAWFQGADHAGDFQAIVPGVLDTAVRDVESVTHTYFQDAGGFGSFAGAIVSGAARSHLAASEVENGGALAAFGGFEQRAAAGLLNVVAVSGDGENINWPDERSG